MNPADDFSTGKSKTKTKKAASKTKAKGTQDPTQPSKFDGAGVAFRCKLFGLTDVEAAKGDKMSLEGIRKMKQESKQNKKDFGTSKQKIVINVSVQGLKIYDEKTGVLKYAHPVHKISYITHDPEDKKIFGFICNSDGATGHTLVVVKHDKFSTLVTSNIYEMFQLIVERKKAKQQAKAQAQNTEQALEAKEEAQDEVNATSETTSQPAEAIYTRPFKPKDPDQVQPPIEQLRYSASEEKAVTFSGQSEQPQKAEEPVSNLLNWDEPPPQAQKSSQWDDMDNFLPGNNAHQGFEPPSPGMESSDAFFSQSAVDAINTSQESGSTSSGPFVLESPQDTQTSNPFAATTFSPSSNSPFGSTTTPATSGPLWGGIGATTQADVFGMGNVQPGMQTASTSGGGAWNNGYQSQNVSVQNQFGNNFVPGQQNTTSFPQPLTETAAPEKQQNDPFADLSGFGSLLEVGRARTKSKSARNSPQSSPVQSPQLGFRSAGNSPMIGRAAGNNPFQTNVNADVFGNTRGPAFPQIPPREDIPSLQGPPSVPRPKVGIPVLPPRVDLDLAASQPAPPQNNAFTTATTTSSSPFGDFVPLADTSAPPSDPFSSNSSFSSPSTQNGPHGLFSSDPYGSEQPAGGGNTSTSSSSGGLFGSDDPFSATATTSSTSQSAFGSTQVDAAKSQSPFGDPFVTLPSTTSSVQSGFDGVFGTSNPQTASTGAGFGNAFSTTSPQTTNSMNDMFGSNFGMSSNPVQPPLGGPLNVTSASPFGSTGNTGAPSSAFQTTSTSSASWGAPFSSSTVSSDPFGSSANSATPFSQPLAPASNQFGAGSWGGMATSPFASGTGTQPLVPGQTASPDTSTKQTDSKPKDDPFASFAVDFTSYKS